MIERRRNRRFQFTQPATIRSGLYQMECTTIDVSPHGLKLRLASRRKIPRHFLLSLRGKRPLVVEVLEVRDDTARVLLLSDRLELAEAVADAIPTMDFLSQNAN